MILPFVYVAFGSLVVLIAVIALKSAPALENYGLELYIKNAWRPSELMPGDYGLLAAIYGTVVSASIALMISTILSLSLVIATEEVLPKSTREFVASLTDVAAGFPSVLFGLWGVDVLAPALKKYLMEPLHGKLGIMPIFSCRPLSGASLLTAGVLLGFMITPFMFALLREVYKMVPSSYKEAALVVSSAWHQYVKLRIGMIRPAVIAAALLGFGRAAGETVAVSLVIGNSFNLSPCLLAPSYTVSALIANQFGNAAFYPLMTEVLFAGSLFLLCVGLTLNGAGVYLMGKVRSFAAR